MSRQRLWRATSRRHRSVKLREGARLADLALPPARSEGVILLHGIGRTHRWMRKLEQALRQAGYATLNLGYASRKKPLDLLAADIDGPISSFAQEIDGPLHFVGHSMGGLLARVYIAKYRPERLGRVVMLGTPNGGSEIADRLRDLALYRAYYGPAGQQLTTRLDSALTSLPALDYAVGVIAGDRSIRPIASLFRVPKPNDTMVSVASTGLDGMADHVVVNAVHARLPHHARAIDETIAFLRDGRFAASVPIPKFASSCGKHGRFDG
jgi:pimeloyl-ACP methyl ester carboxylesterase